MPSRSENGSRLSWNHEIESFARTIMLLISRSVDKWAQDIIKRNGFVLDNIDEKIQDAKDAILADQATRENLWKEREALNDLVVEANSKMKKCNNDASKFKINANKYRIEKDNLEKLKPGTPAYKNQEKRLKKFEPDYKRWVKLTEEAEDWLKKSQDYSAKLKKFENKYSDTLDGDEAKSNAGGRVTHLNSVLKNLLKDKELLENSSVKNMGKCRNELVGAFKDSKYVDAIAGMISNTINNTLNGSMRFNDEFAEDEKFQILEILISGFDTRMDEFNILKPLSSERKYYSEVEIDGKSIKVFDMNNVSTDDMVRVFSGWLKDKVRNGTLNAIRDYKKKRDRFVPEQQNNNGDDDESNSLYEREDVVNQSPYGGKIDDKTINNDPGTQGGYSDIESYLKSHLGNITKLVNDSLQRQLPEKAYFRRIGESKAANELRNVIKKCIDAIGSDFRNGFDCFHRLKDFVKTYTGGIENMDEFNIIYTVIRAALEFGIASKIGKDLLEDVKGLSRDELSQKKHILKIVKEKQDISRSALRNVNSVRYAKRIIKIARNLVEEETFVDPEEMFHSLIKANQSMEDKVDFLLEDIPTPDASGKHNELVNTRPLRNTGDYGA